MSYTAQTGWLPGTWREPFKRINLERSIPLTYCKWCSTECSRAVKNSAMNNCSEIKQEGKKTLHSGFRDLVPCCCMGVLPAQLGAGGNLSGRFSSGFILSLYELEGRRYQTERLWAGRDGKRHPHVCLSVCGNGESRGKQAQPSLGAGNWKWVLKAPAPLSCSKG